MADYRNGDGNESEGSFRAEKITVVCVHQNSETLTSLESALEHQGMRVAHADSRAQTRRMLGELNYPPLIFTDTQLPDGTWADILVEAKQAAQPVNVIVVARLVDTRFYVEAIETGAFDFLAPPFRAADLAYVVRSALDNVVARRGALPHTVHTEEDLS